MINASGIGTYIRNVVPLVVAALPDISFHLMGNSGELKASGWFTAENVTVCDFRAPIYSVSEQLLFPRNIHKNTRLFWAPHYNIPLMYRGRLLVTVHDLFHLAMPQYVKGLHQKIYAKSMFRAVLNKADAILCPSRFTENELVRLLGKPHQPVRVTYNGVDESWFSTEKGQNPHDKPFILYVGNVKPNKNLTCLIDAFELLIDRVPHDLVIVGKKKGFITHDNQVMSKAARLGDRVRFTGYVDSHVLCRYFAYADVFVFPSLYEGFGLPPVEAMACGCPVIVSDCAALPEVCSDAALYCNPYLPEDIADKVLSVLENPDLAEALRRRGEGRARSFSWHSCAEATVEEIVRLLGP
jgi:glycosyltransferase involved in cell wall biosynthesis